MKYGILLGNPLEEPKTRRRLSVEELIDWR